MPLVTLDRVSIAYGHLPLLDEVGLQIEPGERVCVIGRNGTGKSTLLQLIAGDLAPDGGVAWRQPGARVARLVQDVALADSRSVFDVVAEGLGDLSDLVRDYHHATIAVSEHGSAASLDELGRLQHDLEERDGWRVEQRVELVLTKLGLPTDTPVDTLSGGWRRRVLLARALVAQPDILLLDEPTNHLDIEAILWLESFLAEYPGAVVFVTHDRAFLQRLATRIVELDRGRLTSWPGDYATYLERKDAQLATESIAADKFDKRLAQEEVWLRRGVKARRTRDEGRVKSLLAMREARAARRNEIGVVKLRLDVGERSGQLVFEAEGISKSYGSLAVVRDFSTRVIRGDRIGLIGPNGAGKTTLLRILLGEMPPDTGEVRQGANVQVAYYDQQREQLDPERTVFDTIGEGNDTVTTVAGTRHVHGYLADFLFPPERAFSPVKALSGGERNRLLLARLFTRPANLLVLDEPTNDLDLETLELLEAQMMAFPGTVLLVSHDRAFLDNVVTSTFVFEGNGHIEEYVGGYEDWLRQRPGAAAGRPPAPRKAETDPNPRATPGAAVAGKTAPGGTPARKKSSGAPAAAAVATTPAAKAAAPKKRSFREQREFEELPARIEALEAEERRLTAAVADPEFYKESAETIRTTLARLPEIAAELAIAYARWTVLDTGPSKKSL